MQNYGWDLSGPTQRKKSGWLFSKRGRAPAAHLTACSNEETTVPGHTHIKRRSSSPPCCQRELTVGLILCAAFPFSHAAPSTWPLLLAGELHIPLWRGGGSGFVVGFELGAAQLRDRGSVASCRSVRRHVHPEPSAAPGPPACPHTGWVARASRLAFRQYARHPPDFLCRLLWSCRLCTCGCTREHRQASFPLNMQIFTRSKGA